MNETATRIANAKTKTKAKQKNLFEEVHQQCDESRIDIGRL
jgi:hypothetical protein